MKPSGILLGVAAIQGAAVLTAGFAREVAAAFHGGWHPYIQLAVDIALAGSAWTIEALVRRVRAGFH